MEDAIEMEKDENFKNVLTIDTSGLGSHQMRKILQWL